MSSTTKPSSRRRGRFSRESLYEIVAEGCRLAAVLYGVKRIDVSTRQWRHCTRQPEFEKRWKGPVPGPAEICRQLCNGDDRPATWMEVKRRSFLPPDQLLAVERAVLRHAPERITKQRARYSIRVIARKFGVPRAGREYKASLSKLTRQAQRRSKAEAAAVKRTFATESQILAIYGSWNAALRDAHVKPAEAREAHGHVRRGMSWPQAAAIYELVTGKAPTIDAIKRFARDGRFSLPGRADRVTDIRAAAAILVRQAGVEPGAVSLEAAAKALGVTLTLYRFSRVDVIEAGQRYAETLGPGEPASDDGYYAYRQEHPSEPSLQVIKERHGGVRAVVRAGERQDWRQRAIAWDSRKKQQVAVRRETARTARTAAHKAAEPPQFVTRSGRLPSERTLSHLLFVEREKMISTGALAAQLEVHRVRAQQIVRELREYGALEPTVERANSSLQTYRLTKKGHALVRAIKKQRRPDGR